MAAQSISSKFWGTKLNLEYPIIKILDYKDRKHELEQSDNPFAIILLAQLAAIEANGDDEKKLISKFNLTKFLYTHGYNKEDILNMLRFMHQILALSEELSLQYVQRVRKLEGELKVSYMTCKILLKA